MKAKEYVAKSKEFSVEDATLQILNAMVEEANALAVRRNCQGGGDSSFSTYAECFFEQFVKWVAVCRIDSRYNLDSFVLFLGENNPLVLTAIKKKMVPYIAVRTI